MLNTVRRLAGAVGVDMVEGVGRGGVLMQETGGEGRLGVSCNHRTVDDL